MILQLQSLTAPPTALSQCIAVFDLVVLTNKSDITVKVLQQGWVEWEVVAGLVWLERLNIAEQFWGIAVNFRFAFS